MRNSTRLAGLLLALVAAAGRTSGSVHAFGNYIQRNEGRGIDTSGGSYGNNEIAGNDATAPGQVKGPSDAGGNVIH